MEKFFNEGMDAFWQSEIFNEGMDDYWRGLTDCPYPPGSEEASHWVSGYQQAAEVEGWRDNLGGCEDPDG